jgi:hypothetical protein
MDFTRLRPDKPHRDYAVVFAALRGFYFDAGELDLGLRILDCGLRIVFATKRHEEILRHGLSNL